MKSLVSFVAVSLVFPLFAADSGDKSMGDKSSVPPAVRVEPIAPAGQTFSRPASTFSPAIAPEIPVKGGTFSRPESTFTRPHSTFSRPEATLSTPAGSFAHPGPTFSTPVGSFARPASTFSTPGGSFSRPESTFSNPIQGASPLPIGAFGSPIRPTSTFALPALTVGGSFGGSVAILAKPTILAPGGEITARGGEAESSLVRTGSEGAPIEPAAADQPAPVVIDLPPGATLRK